MISFYGGVFIETSNGSGSKKYIKDLDEKESFVSVFLSTDKNMGTDKNGRPFMTVNLRDSSGSLNGRLFEKVEESAKLFESGDFVRVKGHVHVFQNRKQIVIHDIKKASTDEVELKDYVAHGGQDPMKAYESLSQIVSAMSNPFIRKLTQSVIEDAEIKAGLLVAPAAKTIHHAYIGGLIEHILSICNLLEAVSKQYPELDKDLLIFGGIFHDLGKIWELGLGGGIHYTDKGRLVGHMVIACEVIDKKASLIEEFPEALLNVLKHIVLSHHGKLEYGSPKLPSLPEAVVVAMIDDLDSRMNTILQFMKEELTTGQSWTRYHPQFDRYFYLEHFRK